MNNHEPERAKDRKYDSVMTVMEMCEYLSISKTYAYQLLEKKEIPHIRFGRTYRILKQDLDEYCRRHKQHDFSRLRKS